VAAPRQQNARALGIFVILLAVLAVWTWFPNTDHAPRLGLDLRGGTQVTLTPKTGSGTITDSQLQQAVEIIRQRVNGLGVAEAEVTTQGSGANAAIIVSIPGVSEQGIAGILQRTASLSFRPVVAEAAASSIDTSTADVGWQQSDSYTALAAAYAGIDCSKAKNKQGGFVADSKQYLVTCSTDGQLKYLLEPAFIEGTNVTNATAGIPEAGTTWQVDLSFDSAGAQKLSDASSTMYLKSSPQNQFAIVLDGVVFSSPYFKEPILGGSAQITGSFTQKDATELANVLKYGALPVALDIAEVNTLSPTLGQDQLDAGLLAGFIGLLLVLVYVLLYYRALGAIAIASLGAAALLLYMLVVVLGRQLGFTLTLAGVTGAIVAIGITADSFIVYFERIRDEIRDGRNVRAAVDAGWVRARRTILAADFVTGLSAVVLYFLSIGSVRGFAFTLGLTTLIDVGVAFMFTRPIVGLLAKKPFFSGGAKLSGVNARSLGIGVAEGMGA
jgi:preprotein translocase subunit SecD